jgi:hypothetical protein
MSASLQLLEAEISDVGPWSGWGYDRTRNIFWVEFRGVQLRGTSVPAGDLPPGSVSLFFSQPRFVRFISHADRESKGWTSWLSHFQRGQLSPLRVWKPLTLTDPDTVQTVMSAHAASVGTFIGEADEPPPRTGEAMLAMWCIGTTILGGLAPYRRYQFGQEWGPMGVVVAAPALSVTLDGRSLAPDDIRERSDRWWSHRKAYWDRIGMADALPAEYACDVTIPHASGRNLKMETYHDTDVSPIIRATQQFPNLNRT